MTKKAAREVTVLSSAQGVAIYGEISLYYYPREVWNGVVRYRTGLAVGSAGNGDLGLTQEKIRLTQTGKGCSAGIGEAWCVS